MEAKLTIVNTETGELVDYKTASVSETSAALLALDGQIKKLKKMFDTAKDWLGDNRVEEDKFGDWKVSTSNRETLRKPAVEDLPKELRNKYIEAKRFVEETDKEFGQVVLTQFKIWKRPML